MDPVGYGFQRKDLPVAVVAFNVADNVLYTGLPLVHIQIRGDLSFLIDEADDHKKFGKSKEINGIAVILFEADQFGKRAVYRLSIERRIDRLLFGQAHHLAQ